jgi:uncharacterized membrane protein
MQGAPSSNGVDQRPAETRNPVVVTPDSAGPYPGPYGAEPQPAEPRSPEVRPPEVPRKPLSAYLPAENVTAALSYLFGWISGIIVLLVDRRPFVRYHAAQSVVVFATLSVVLLLLGGFFLGTFLPQAAGVLFLLRRIVEVVWLVTAIVLMLKAVLGERYRVPYAARFADRALGTNA